MSADDTGVTICYNSVANINAINPMISASQICINPVSWKCNNTPAELKDSVTVSVNTTHKVLIVDGLDSKSLYIPKLGNLFKLGNYHLQELELYRHCLQNNIENRIQAFHKNH